MAAVVAWEWKIWGSVRENIPLFLIVYAKKNEKSFIYYQVLNELLLINSSVTVLSFDIQY